MKLAYPPKRNKQNLMKIKSTAIWDQQTQSYIRIRIQGFYTTIHTQTRKGIYQVGTYTWINVFSREVVAHSINGPACEIAK